MSASAAIRFHAPAAGGPAGAGGKVDGACEIQLCRRQQRSRPGSGRRPDRGGQRGAQARGQGRSRPIIWRTVRRAIGPCANSSPQKLKRDAGIDCTADDILIVSGSLQALDLVNHTLLARGDTVLIEQESYQGSLNRLDPARRQRGRHPARLRRHADGCAGGGACRPQAARHHAEIYLHHPDGAEPDRQRSSRRRAAPRC